MAAAPTISAAVCERLITTAIDHCTSASQIIPAAPTPAPSYPNFDALAASFGALSVAFTIGTIVIGILGLVAAFAWAHSIRNMAEREAKKEAERCTTALIDAHMKRWLTDAAPVLVRQHVENIANATLGNGDDVKAAEEIGKEAGQ